MSMIIVTVRIQRSLTFLTFQKTNNNFWEMKKKSDVVGCSLSNGCGLAIDRTYKTAKKTTHKHQCVREIKSFVLIRYEILHFDTAAHPDTHTQRTCVNAYMNECASECIKRKRQSKNPINIGGVSIYVNVCAEFDVRVCAKEWTSVWCDFVSFAIDARLTKKKWKKI